MIESIAEACGIDPLSFLLEGSGSLTVHNGALARAWMIATAIMLTLKSMAIALFSLPYRCSVFSDQAHNYGVSGLTIQLYNRYNSTRVDSKHNITYLCKYLLMYTPSVYSSVNMIYRDSRKE